MTKPSIFVGSSSEGLKAAQAIEFQLHQEAEVTIWNEGFFGLSGGTLETLVNALERFDFAILVLTPDDLVMSRDVSTQCPRDNVMFELGLFMGRLGRSRTFIVCNSAENLKLPSDLAGVTIARYDGNRSDKNLIAAVGPACTLIRNAMRDLGIYEGKSVYQLQKATHQVEGISETVSRLVHLLARSRAVELDITTSMFGQLLSDEFMAQLRRDLKELEDSTKEKKHSSEQTGA
jgi:hypothetical protein